MVASSLIPSHSIATWILKHIDRVLEAVGLGNGSVAEEVVYTIVVITIAIAVGWLLRTIIVLTIKHTPLLRRFKTGRELIEQKVIGRCSHIIPPLVFLALIPFAFDSHSNTLELINRGAAAYLLISTGIGLSSVMGFLWLRYDRYRNTKNLPLRGVLNVGRGTLWIIITIVTVSVLIDKSPAVLLTGLGAFAAALMLIFKDSILGFVAGVQISQNDMLRVGDWVIIPSTIANGIVTDVTLSVVKIRNWDNSIVTLPPYTLVSTSFQNWRGMAESGIRLISRSILIDNSSIKQVPSSTGGEETNLGAFRAYMTEYLKGHPKISNNHIIMTRLMQGDAYGTPLQIYCFAATTEWAKYESIQSEIVEHAMMTCPTFHLAVSDCNFVST